MQVQAPVKSRDWENTFAVWARPPSEAEQQRCANAERAVREAIRASRKLQYREITVFTHGSFRNRVNSPRESDVDVGVLCVDTFNPYYPPGITGDQLGHQPATYGYATFKNEVEEALVDYFGRSSVHRGNKAFDIRANSQLVDADVAPFFEHRRYFEHEGKYYHESGVVLFPDNGWRIINWPEQHYENGVAKNLRTNRAYKGLVRILKSLRNEMDDAGIEVAKPMCGFLLECLAWNVADSRLDHERWEDIVQDALTSLWVDTLTDEPCKEWGEVSELKYLFRPIQPWTREQAHSFIETAWEYVGIRR
ncbi:nucleotidyltransferase [bacterium]|nr:nucleotidyltransferase [bacterium]